MTSQSLAYSIAATRAIPLASDTATGDFLSAAIDSQSFASATVVVHTAALAGTVTIEIHESDTSGGTYVAVPGATLVVVASTSQYGHLALATGGRKQFLKVVAIVAGGGSTTTSSDLILHGARYQGGTGSDAATPDFEV